MQEILTAIGSTYAITSKNGCTVTYPNGDPIIEVPAGQQTLFIAQSRSILVSDEEARVTACGGSATLNFTSAAPSILSEGGSTGGLTSEERVLLNGAAQRDADNTFTAANTFTGSVDMSTASVTPPSGWNVGELTAEEVQAVVPIKWGTNLTFGNVIDNWTNTLAIGNGASSKHNGCIAIGHNSSAGYGALAIGTFSNATANASIGVGQYTQVATQAIALGNGSQAKGELAVSIGREAAGAAATAITIGAKFVETVDGQNVANYCQTQGTGSITIGAGANTLNNGDVESSNSVTIGCKALNQGADSVVIGAQAKGKTASIAIGVAANGAGGISIGANSVAVGTSIAIGKSSQISGNMYSVSLGDESSISGANAVAVGYRAKAKSALSVAVGSNATVSDLGAVVFRSTASDGTYTQLYFSGANTPLANTYHGGAPMLGYVTKDSAGNIVAAGTRSLIDLLTDNSTFQPASLDENGEWVMPTVFHPSDLDLPVEEPSEPEEYQPLPVYPIVEPEIEE